MCLKINQQLAVVLHSEVLFVSLCHKSRLSTRVVV